MMIRGYEIGARLIAIVVVVIVLILAVSFTVRSCDVRRSKAAQTRMETAQAQAQSNSAADAIATVQRSGDNSAASEALTRSNEEEIRNAKGSNQAVDPAARDAGLASLCRRTAYRDDPKCRVRQPHP